MENTINRAMIAVFGPALSKLFNWYGKKGKAACKDLEVAQVIFGMIDFSCVVCHCMQIRSVRSAV